MSSAYTSPRSDDPTGHPVLHEVSPGQAAVEQSLVDAVVQSFASCEDPRLHELMVSLVRHLHSFIREVRLTEEEWGSAIRFLTQAGHITDDVRQEFILLSDTLGASMQTINVNNQAYKIEVWEADEDGLYDVQYDASKRSARGRLFSDTNGEYRFWALTPTPYPIPNDGPVGRMLDAVGRSPLRASHLHFMVSHDGQRTLVTHIFPAGDPIGRRDSVFGVKDSLIKEFTQQAAGTPTPDGRQIDGTWSRARFDIVLAPAGV